MRSFALLLACLLSASCGTLMNRGPFMVPIDTVPSGATVTYLDARVGITPCTVAMRASCSQVAVELSGFHSQLVHVGSNFNGWVIGNLLLGGLPGLIVDAASGSFMEVDTAAVSVRLTPESDPKPAVWERPDDYDEETGPPWRRIRWTKTTSLPK